MEIVFWVLLGGVLVLIVFLRRFAKPACPVYLAVDDKAENIEWLILSLLHTASQAQLILIDGSGGVHSRLLHVLARRYRLHLLQEKPDAAAPVLYATAGVDAEHLCAAYEKLRGNGRKMGKADEI